MNGVRDVSVRVASAEDYAGLAALEQAADAVFEQYGMWPLPQVGDAAGGEVFAGAAAVS